MYSMVLLIQKTIRLEVSTKSLHVLEYTPCQGSDTLTLLKAHSHSLIPLPLHGPEN